MPKQSARLLLVNDVNFLLYTPFLPEAAAGTLEPRHVVTPLRDILKRTNLRLGAVTGHDPEAKTVRLDGHDGASDQLHYDRLVVAVGSVSRLLPIPGLAEHGIGFKSLSDAIWLRNHLIETLESANATEDPALRGQMLSYVFVGGGYAGLEALAELQDFAADAIQRYPRARLHGMRWILVEAAPGVLGEVDPKLGEYTVRELRGRGIEVMLSTRLEQVEKDSVRLSSGETVPCRTLVWTAGVAPHPSLRGLALPLAPSGHVPVDQFLRVAGYDGVYAVGDCAAVPNPDGGLCPPTAQHAVRQGKTAAINVAADLGIGAAERFSYRSRGMFANLGRFKAIGSTGGTGGRAWTFHGFPAWWMARTYHMSQLPGAARKLRAIADWTIGLAFSRDTAEVGSIGHPRPLREEVYARGGTHRPLSEDR